MLQYKSNTVFSKLPSMIKFIYLVINSILLVLPIEFVSIGLIVQLSLLLIVKYKDWKNLILAVLPFLIMSNIFYTLFIITNQGWSIDNVLLINFRLFLIFSSVSFFNYTTNLYDLLRVFKKLGLPETIYLTIYFMLRFLPEIEREAKEVWIIQSHRFKDESIFKKIQAFFLPLLYSLVERANDLAITCYLKEKIGEKI